MNVVHVSSLTGAVVRERLQVHGKTAKGERSPRPYNMTRFPDRMCFMDTPPSPRVQDAYEGHSWCPALCGFGQTYHDVMVSCREVSLPEMSVSHTRVPPHRPRQSLILLRPPQCFILQNVTELGSHTL